MARRASTRHGGLVIKARWTGIAAAFLLSIVLSTPAAAQAGGASAETRDRGYGPGRPVPRELMRSLSADRPDGTESPYTVDAGHWQLEVSFIEYSRDDGADAEAWALFDSNVKLGLTDQIDLQLLFGLYTDEEIDPPGPARQELEGFGDVTVRMKVNLWGNDGGPTAFGLMPFVKIPTGTELSNDEVEGGLIASLAWAAGPSWGLGFMAEADAVHDGMDDDHDIELVHTAVAGFELAGQFGGYVEYIGVTSSDGDVGSRASLSAGVTYGVSDDVQLDAGLRVGLNDAAEDLVLFTGFTARF